MRIVDGWWCKFVVRVVLKLRAVFGSFLEHFHLQGAAYRMFHVTLYHFQNVIVGIFGLIRKQARHDRSDAFQWRKCSYHAGTMM
jgi:hypothetical protein